jgi:membrane-associated protein
VSRLLDVILSVNAVLVYAIVAGLVFAEDALFIGFVVPGETAAVLGGVDASRGHVAVISMAIAVVAAAIAGDSVGYEIGRVLGPRLVQARPLRSHGRRLKDAQDFLARRGGSAVFLGRFVAFFRAVIPALAGASRMRYRTFLGFNAAGGITWGVGCVVLGYLAGNSYQRVERVAGRAVAVVVAVLIIVALIAWRVRKHVVERRRSA